ncbi:MAG: GerMN domain-containing protein [bacterium]
MRFWLRDPSRPASRGDGRQGSRRRVVTLILTAGLLPLLAVAISVAATGCGGGSGVGDGGTVGTTEGSQTTVTMPPEDTTTIPSRPTTTVAQETMTVRVYFSRDEKMCAAARVIPKTQDMGAAAMKALLEGPTAAEKAIGMVSSIPEGTTFLGLNIKDGVASVDLSKEYASGGGSLSMMMRLAEVVFTLTQFPTVDGVNFRLDGEAIDVLGGEGLILDHPMSRADHEDLSPAILVESPLLGQTVSSPVRIWGTSNTFEATCLIRIVNRDGLTVAKQVVTATSGNGERGTFDVTISFTVDRGGPGSIIAFEESAQDGSVINLVEIPVQLED